MDNLEKVEKLRERANVSYEEAKAALEQSDWDLLDAMVKLEKSGKTAGPRQSDFRTSAETQEDYVAVKDKVMEQQNKKVHVGRTLGDVFRSFFRVCRDNAFCVNRACEQVFRELCPRFKGFSGGVRMDDPTVSQFFHRRFEEWHFYNDLVYSRDAFIARCLSGSYAPKEGEDSYDAFVSAVSGIFDEFQQDGSIVVPNMTDAYVGSLR